MLDDGTITRIADTEYRITAADPCYRWFLLNATGLDVEVQDVSESLAGLALQGKLSREVLEAATRPGLDRRPVLPAPRAPRSAAST